MSDSLLLSPVETVAYATEAGFAKASKIPSKVLISSIVAGALIALGAIFSVNTSAGMADVPYGIVKLLSGFTFSIGLVMVMFTGSDLFTGSTMLANAAADCKITWGKYFGNISLVYIGNLVGALLIVGMLWGSGWIDHAADGNVAKVLAGIAEKKSHLTMIGAFCAGIFANIFVCMGVWLAWASKTPTGKIIGCMLPVAAFVAAGFEHSVANMFYFPAGILSNNLLNLGKNIPLNGIMINMVFSTLGNLVGGAVFVGLANRAMWKK